MKPRDKSKSYEYHREKNLKYRCLEKFETWIGKTCAAGCGEIITKFDIETIASKQLKEFKTDRVLNAVEIYRINEQLQPVCSRYIEEYIQMETGQEDEHLNQDFGDD